MDTTKMLSSTSKRKNNFSSNLSGNGTKMSNSDKISTFNGKSTNLEISSSIVITSDEIACFHIANYVLNSHKNLTIEDINYAVNFICSFYIYSLENPSNDILLHNNNLILFLTYADKNSIGKFALIFNERLDEIIKNRDNNRLRFLLLGPKEMFVELYDNPYLTKEDRNFLIELVRLELHSNSLLFKTIKKSGENFEFIPNGCLSTEITSHVNENNGVVNMTTLTVKCYDEVCIEENQDVVNGIMIRKEKLPNSVYTVDKTINGKPQVYCFDTLELLDIMTKDKPINPKTGQVFSDYSIKIIKQRFRKEIAMYKRYIQLRDY